MSVQKHCGWAAAETHRPRCGEWIRHRGVPGIIVEYACSVGLGQQANAGVSITESLLEKVHGLEVHRLRHLKQIKPIHTDYNIL